MPNNPNLLDLPDELILYAFAFVRFEDKIQLLQVSKDVNRIADDYISWAMLLDPVYKNSSPNYLPEKAKTIFIQDPQARLLRYRALGKSGQKWLANEKKSLLQERCISMDSSILNAFFITWDYNLIHVYPLLPHLIEDWIILSGKYSPYRNNQAIIELFDLANRELSTSLDLFQRGFSERNQKFGKLIINGLITLERAIASGVLAYDYNIADCLYALIDTGKLDLETSLSLTPTQARNLSSSVIIKYINLGIITALQAINLSEFQMEKLESITMQFYVRNDFLSIDEIFQLSFKQFQCLNNRVISELISNRKLTVKSALDLHHHQLLYLREGAVEACNYSSKIHLKVILEFPENLVFNLNAYFIEKLVNSQKKASTESATLTHVQEKYLESLKVPPLLTMDTSDELHPVTVSQKITHETKRGPVLGHDGEIVAVSFEGDNYQHQFRKHRFFSPKKFNDNYNAMQMTDVNRDNLNMQSPPEFNDLSYFSHDIYNKPIY